MRRTPTPNSSNYSRSPTPSPTPTSKSRRKNLPFYNLIDSFLIQISHNKVLFPIILILTILLSTIMINMAPSFCSSDGSQTSFKCKRCPDNARCNCLSFKCEKGFYKINNNCVTETQNENYKYYKYLASNISRILHDKKVSNLNELAENLDETNLQIREAIEYTDYRITGDNEAIEKVFYSPSKVLFMLCTILSYLILIYGMVILGYHFLRTN
ncbi:hypothetical protein M9Y10_021257 [Tritrichomonas musculus]|uniref:Uncharacterized protein n=1 Tax=Tritrichomonas musculus TaxID=1915356 RepID=A0ABR2GK40_9EUKA